MGETNAQVAHAHIGEEIMSNISNKFLEIFVKGIEMRSKLYGDGYGDDFQGLRGGDGCGGTVCEAYGAFDGDSHGDGFSRDAYKKGSKITNEDCGYYYDA